MKKATENFCPNASHHQFNFTRYCQNCGFERALQSPLFDCTIDITRDSRYSMGATD